MRKLRKPEAQARGWGSGRSCCYLLSRRDLVPLRSNALSVTHLVDFQPLARAAGFHDSRSFFHVRSGAAGGGAKLKLQWMENHPSVATDRAVTAKERYRHSDAGTNEPCCVGSVGRRRLRDSPHRPICDRVPLPHGHGSVRVASEDHRRRNPSFFLEWGQHRPGCSPSPKQPR